MPDVHTAAALAADEVVAAVWALRDPGLPGTPWTPAQIASVLPLLAEGPSDLATEAWSARMLAAADEG